MSRPKWLQSLIDLRLEFWLLLPLSAIAFWWGTGWLNQQVLSQSYNAVAELQTTEQQQAHLDLNLTILSINAEVDRRDRITEVTVKTTDSVLKELEFEFPLTEFAEVEAAIAQELHLSPLAVRQLIRYQIEN